MSAHPCFVFVLFLTIRKTLTQPTRSGDPAEVYYKDRFGPKLNLKNLLRHFVHHPLYSLQGLRGVKSDLGFRLQLHLTHSGFETE